MKTVCQITMFRTINYGSALQAYALHTAVTRLLGHRCLTVDYVAQAGERTFPRSPAALARYLLGRAVYWRRDRAYDAFLRRELDLTRPYASFAELAADPPAADVYATGSDQTFNPQWSGADPAYFLAFVPADKRPTVCKIAYASSFAVSALPEALRPRYREALSDYDALSVREESGVALIRDLTGQAATWCCDPTLLLERTQWAAMAQKAARRPKRPYILVYIMAYMVNPYPQADRVIDEVARALGLDVVYLNGRRQDLGKPRATVNKSASPYEFVDLFLNASFIVTSSFHGAVFSLHSGKPFIALTEADPRKDSRLRALLRRVGAERHAVPVPIPDDFHVGDPARFAQPTGGYAERLGAFREESLAWLRAAIVGDALYGKPALDRRLPYPPARQLLHARRLCLNHPITGHPLDLQAPFPKDFSPYL